MTVTPRVHPRLSVTAELASVSVILESVDTSVTGVIGEPQGSCQTVCHVGNVLIIGIGSSETSGVCIYYESFR